MTTDHFLRVFKKCPGCKERLTIANELEDPHFPIITCQGCLNFYALPLLEDPTQIEKVVLYHDDKVYEFINDTISSCKDESSEDLNFRRTECATSCTEDMMVRLFKKPKQIIKYFMLS